MKSEIAKITVTERVRKDLGKIKELAADIGKNGLINPLTVMSETGGGYRLIAGLRRLKAAQSLGWTEIDVNVVSPADAEAELMIEISENEQREPFSFSERMDYGRMLEEIEKAKALGRMSAGGKGGYDKDAISEGVLPGAHLEGGKSRDIIGAKIGMSGMSYDRAKYIAENAPQEIIDELDKGKRSIRPTFDELKKGESEDEKKVPVSDSKSPAKAKKPKTFPEPPSVPEEPAKPSILQKSGLLTKEEVEELHAELEKNCTPEQREISRLLQEIRKLKTENDCLKNNILQFECGVVGYERRIAELNAELAAANARIAELEGKAPDGLGESNEGIDNQ